MKRNVHLSLTEEELQELYQLLEQSKANSLRARLTILLEPDPANPDPYVREQVYLALSRATGKSPDEISDSDTLEAKLRLDKYERRALKDDFQIIVRDLGSSQRIYRYECEDLKKVIDCITLVRSRV